MFIQVSLHSSISFLKQNKSDYFRMVDTQFIQTRKK